jgi:hypothetical protein
MTLISISRKGFDYSAGGKASPIINNRFISLPIPEGGSDLFYKELHFSGLDTNLFEMMRQLGIKQYSECHLDPILNPSLYGLLKRNGFSQAFGQDDTAQSHLNSHHFGAGDIFLFFGRFGHTERKASGEIKWASTKPFHAVYGFMEVGALFQVNKLTNQKLLRDLRNHPHIKKPNFYKENSTIYLPAHKSRHGFNKTVGTFNFQSELQLTVSTRMNDWQLPKAFANSHFSYLKEIDSNGSVRCPGRGQEFIGNANSAILNWIKKLINNHSA